MVRWMPSMLRSWCASPCCAASHAARSRIIIYGGPIRKQDVPVSRLQPDPLHGRIGDCGSAALRRRGQDGLGHNKQTKQVVVIDDEPVKLVGSDVDQFANIVHALKLNHGGSRRGQAERFGAPELIGNASACVRCGVRTHALALPSFT